MDRKKLFKTRTSAYGIIIVSVLAGITSLIVYRFGLTDSFAQINTKQNEIKKEVKFFNKTKSFEIINSKITGKEMELILKNSYGKSINGFYIIVGSGKEGSVYNVELLYSETRNEIPPDETFTLTMGLEERLYTEGATISAVLFTDGTGDGEAETIQEMQDIRQGEKFQLSKGLELLKNTTTSQSADLASALENLKIKLSLFETSDKTKSPAYNSGLYTGKGRLIRNFDDLQMNKDTNRLTTEQEFLKFQSKLGKYISKL